MRSAGRPVLKTVGKTVGEAAGRTAGRTAGTSLGRLSRELVMAEYKSEGALLKKRWWISECGLV